MREVPPSEHNNILPNINEHTPLSLKPFFITYLWEDRTSHERQESFDGAKKKRMKFGSEEQNLEQGNKR